MKRTRLTLLLIAALLAISSCDDFLDIRQEATLPTTGIDYTKPENIFLSVSAAYSKLRSWDAHTFPYIGAFEIASDNADKGSTPEDNPEMKDIDNLNFQPTNGLINGLWTGYFDIVSGANYAIHQMPLFVETLPSQTDRDYAIQCQGEAKAIRAYAYFNLTRLFGRVPIVDTVLSSEQLASLKQALEFGFN